MIKKIGILTSGGDAPGMNAALSATIRVATMHGIEVYGIKDGFLGLVNGWFEKLSVSFAHQYQARGGTAIGSARLPEFKEESVRQKAVDNLKKEGIEALIVIGGDGSYMGAQRLTEMGINCIGLPGTIDNDIVSTDYTIGFDTALNTVVEAIDKIRDTVASHNRCAVVEIMGNQAPDLTMYAAIATGAEIFSVKDSMLSVDEIIKQVNQFRVKNKRSVIVLISEKIYYVNVEEIAKRIEKETGYVTRASVLGHIQRGGSPSAMDRCLAFNAAKMAVDKLIEGKGGLYIGLDGNELVARDIKSTLSMPRIDHQEEIDIIRKINVTMDTK